MSEPEITGGTPREDPTDGTPRKKARSGKVAVDRTEAAGAIKGVREAEAIDNDDVDESTSVGCRRPTTPVPITQAGRRRRGHERQAPPSHDRRRRGRRRRRGGHERRAPPSHHGHDRRRRGQRR